MGSYTIISLTCPTLQNTNFGGQEDRCAKIGIRKTENLCVSVCLHIYVLTVLPFKIFLGNC